MRDTYSYLLATLPVPEYRQVAVTSHQLLGEIIDTSYHQEGYLLLEQLFKVQMIESPKYWVDTQVMGDGVTAIASADNDVGATENIISVDATDSMVADSAVDVTDHSLVGFGTIVYSNCKRIKEFLLQHIELTAHTEREPLIMALHSAMHNTLHNQSNAVSDTNMDDAAQQQYQRNEEYWAMLKMELELVHKQVADVVHDAVAVHPIERAYRSWRQFYFGVRGEIARNSVLAQSHEERIEWPHTDSQYARTLLLDIENSDNPLEMTKTVERFIYDWIYAQFESPNAPAVAKLFWYYLLTITNERLALLTERQGLQVLSQLIATNKQLIHTLITEKLQQAQSVAT